MGLKTILYVSCTSSEEMYKKLFATIEQKPGQQVQKYHRLFAEGFLKNNCNICMITALPLNRQNYESKVFWKYTEIQKDIQYDYLFVLNIPIMKNIEIFFLSFIKILIASAKYSDVYVICDVLNQSVALGALIASKIKKFSCIGIVTDIPDMLSGKKNWRTKFHNWVLNQYSSYIFLTENMNKKINKKKKPYVVLEGHVDNELGELPIEKKYDKFICLYSGALSRQYGLHLLVEGFVKANLPETELHLYGDGDYVSELKEFCKQYDSIKYFGICLNDYVVKEQQKATLLINPRPTYEEFTKYSFPSKNMEYMVSGTPVLTTKLPGMPEEYYPYVYLLEEETSDGISKELLRIYNLGKDRLKEKGKAARQFVLQNKSNEHQALKVINELMGGE